jgi:hypothetical protein
MFGNELRFQIGAASSAWGSQWGSNAPATRKRADSIGREQRDWDNLWACPEASGALPKSGHLSTLFGAERAVVLVVLVAKVNVGWSHALGWLLPL